MQEHESHPHQHLLNDGSAIYTCPMHPEVRQVGPGSCPKCGMALEPVLPGEEEDDRYRRRRFWMGALFTLPLVVIAMWYVFFPQGLLEKLAAAMSMSSVSVVGNALRLKSVKIA